MTTQTMAAPMVTATFSVGAVHATPRAFNEISRSVLQKALRRHKSGDWGEAQVNEIHQNEAALLQGGQITSRYSDGAIRFVICTDADRSSTLIALDDEFPG